MPSAVEVREQRIKTLLEWAERKNVKLIDDLLAKARELYPTLRETTREDYCIQVLRLIQSSRGNRYGDYDCF